ncbi:MAG: AglZ/HisF2 family acetamidino modification protein [Bacteroidales bacterium]|jgi:cyclase
MYRPRIIPVLLLQNKGLVKSIQFENHRYIGDPINAVRIFNDLYADELAFLDIDATKQGRLVSLEIVKNVGEEANMPFSVGGGINSLSDIHQIINAGAEKVIITTKAVQEPEFINEAVKEFGSSTIVVCIDVKKKSGRPFVYSRNGKNISRFSPIEFARLMVDHGAGELIVQSIERDGKMEGYDLDLISSISQNVTIPIVGLGGAGNLKDMHELESRTTINGLAAGSMFVYHGPRRGVLINYPNQVQLKTFIN